MAKQGKSCGCIIVHGNKTLLVCTAQGMHWMFPKGRQRRGESEIECAVRESRQETGLEELTVDPDFRIAFRWTAKDVRYDSTRLGKEIVGYLAYAKKSGPLRYNPDEILCAAWVPIVNVEKHVSRPSAKLAIAEALKYHMIKQEYHA